jgi:DNA-binding transcriptional LysR family regulator
MGHETVAVQPVLLVGSTESLRAAAIAGLGVAPVPDRLVTDALAACQLTRVLANYETPSSGILCGLPDHSWSRPGPRVGPRRRGSG